MPCSNCGCCNGSSRQKYHVSPKQSLFTVVHRPRSIVILEPVPVRKEQVRKSNPNESDDEYCRRKSKTYGLKVDELAVLKKQTDLVKSLMDGAREYEKLKMRKTQYEEFDGKVVWLEKQIEEEKKAILRKNRL